jgi:hypothetical protein
VPDVRATWIELQPLGGVDLESASELARLDDWLALAELAKRHVPETFGQLGFDRAIRVLTTFVAELTIDTEPVRSSERRELVAEVLERLSRLVPAWRYLRYVAIDVGRPPVAEFPAARIEYKPLSPQMERLLAPRARVEPSDEWVVLRVLRDL